jgi:hypothetical protein
MKITKQVDSLYSWVDKNNAKINKEIKYYELLLAGVLGSSPKECLDYCFKIRALRNKLI